MDPLTREQILASTLAYEDVEVPAWGRVVRLREMSLFERTAFETAVFTTSAHGDRLACELLVRVCTEPGTGERLFRDEDADALGATSGRAMQPLYIPALRLSGYTEEEAESLGKEPAGAGGSTTSSPSASENPLPSSS